MSKRWTQQPGSDEVVRMRGVRVHNLQNIDLDIPRNRLVVISGPSGSGKSSLAFDTLYAEGQRQYIESLSVYARQFLHQLERPDVDLIDGLQPTISIDQRAGVRNPRTTVATVTEIYDHMRLLYARLGEVTCYRCGRPIRQQAPAQIVDALMRLTRGTRVMILAPMVRGRKGQHKDVFAAIRRAGFLRVRVDGQVVDIEQPPDLVRQRVHHIEAVVDRVVVREGLRGRLAESIQLALKHGDGLVLANEPEVILLDEPTSGLDPISTARIEETLSQLKKDYTIILVSNNTKQIARVADKVAFLLMGQLIEYGVTSKVFMVPKDKRTDDYISGRFG
ncbi:MAG TPA: hypothetical protein EYP56_16065 [Planctomycetaceae bacterium]|nr:hypothetical protein [Planctomycetaceae bacterium]